MLRYPFPLRLAAQFYYYLLSKLVCQSPQLQPCGDFGCETILIFLPGLFPTLHNRRAFLCQFNLPLGNNVILDLSSNVARYHWFPLTGARAERQATAKPKFSGPQSTWAGLGSFLHSETFLPPWQIVCRHSSSPLSAIYSCGFEVSDSIHSDLRRDTLDTHVHCGKLYYSDVIGGTWYKQAMVLFTDRCILVSASHNILMLYFSQS